jgi:hypothetical protein
MRHVVAITVILVLLAALLVSGGQESAPAGGGTPQETSIADLAKAVAKEKQDRSALCDSLMKFAADQSNKPDDRRRAVFLLADLGGRKGMEFCVSNVSMYVPKNPSLGDEDTFLELPCRAALNRNDWQVAQVILESLDRKMSEIDLIRLGYPFKTALGPNLAAKVLEHEMEKAKGDLRKKNVAILRKSVTQ